MVRPHTPMIPQKRPSTALPDRDPVAKSRLKPQTWTSASSMQRTLGNRVVARLAQANHTLQPKLTVGPVGDRYEQEADRVARQVVHQLRAPAAQRQDLSEEDETLQAKPIATLQRQAGLDEEEAVQEKLIVRRRSDGSMDATPEVEAGIRQARAGGRPLERVLQTTMGRALGADFSGVRVHTGAQADGLNRAIQARAFTTGRDIFFRRGEYSPGTTGGQELIAHELTHVVQQGGASVVRKMGVGAGAIQVNSSDRDQLQMKTRMDTDAAIREAEAEADRWNGRGQQPDPYNTGNQNTHYLPSYLAQDTMAKWSSKARIHDMSRRAGHSASSPADIDLKLAREDTGPSSFNFHVATQQEKSPQEQQRRKLDREQKSGAIIAQKARELQEQHVFEIILDRSGRSGEQYKNSIPWGEMAVKNLTGDDEIWEFLKSRLGLSEKQKKGGSQKKGKK